MNRMILMRLITRCTAKNNQQLHTSIRLLSKNDSSSSSDSSDSDNEKSKENRAQAVPNEKTKKETVDLLNSLLAKMSAEQKKPKTVDRAIPERKPLPKPVKPVTLEEKLIGAAKDVASTLGGNVKQTEAELLDKIFSAGTPAPKPTTPPKSTRSESTSLSDLFAGMKIDRAPQKTDDSSEGYERSRSEKVQELARKFQRVRIQPNKDSQFKSARTKFIPGNLFGGKPLNIFDPIKETAKDEDKTLETWKLLERKELDRMLVHPPNNILEEMIQWTNKGILWKFPIDNEYGMEKEQNVHFSKHVFLERHLHGWCPKTGPIRHFMDLVCIGLSKNPYMTANEKKNHIMWYRKFFGSKQELLKEVGAIEKDIIPASATLTEP